MKDLDNVQAIWEDFYVIVKLLKPDVLTESDCQEIERATIAWFKLFGLENMESDATPYIHVFRHHVPKLIKLYGNLIFYFILF